MAGQLTLKQKSPETFDFFKEFWIFMDKYWDIPEDEEEKQIWWTSFYSEMEDMLKKYNDSIFFSDIIMTFFDNYICNNNIQ